MKIQNLKQDFWWKLYFWLTVLSVGYSLYPTFKYYHLLSFDVQFFIGCVDLVVELAVLYGLYLFVFNKKIPQIKMWKYVLIVVIAYWVYLLAVTLIGIITFISGESLIDMAVKALFGNSIGHRVDYLLARIFSVYALYQISFHGKTLKG